MCKTDRESYEKYWDDISPFIKFGCIKDSKFSEKLHDYILFKDVDNKYLTLKDCIEQNKKEDTAESDDTKKEDAENKENAEKKEPEKTTIFYVTDPVQQSQYINMFREAGKMQLFFLTILIQLLSLTWNRKIRQFSSRELMQM